MIVGAGLAGLACARTLIASGIGVRLLESSDGVGGRVRSDSVDGFTLDRGFQILLTAYPELERWYSLDDLDLQLFHPGASVWTGSGFRTVGDPLRSPRDLPATILTPIGSVADKLRLLRLIASVRRGSVPDLLRREDGTTRQRLERCGFSERFISAFFQPLFSGIQLDPDLEVSSRRFDTILRMLAVGSSGVPADGMGTLSSNLAAALPPEAIVLNTRVNDVSGTRVHTDSGVIDAAAVVVATQGPVASELLGIADPGSRPVAAVWFDSTNAPLAGRRIVLDGAASGPVKNLAPMSNVAPSYAPPGRSLHVAAIPGPDALRPNLEDDVRAQLASWHPGVSTWQTLRVDVIPHGQPLQRPPFDPRRTVRVGDGRYVCGDHRDTASIQGALFSGRRAAAAVLADLAGVTVDGR